MGKNVESRYWIGFDLGGTKMLAAVYDSDFQKLTSEKKKTKSREGMEAGLERICNTIREAMEAAGIEAAHVAGIGLACPGPLDLNKGVVLEAPNLGWEQVPLKKHIEKTFKCPAVILNDVDAGVYGEYRFGAARKARCVLGVFPGTGIGGGCVYEGRVVRGRRNSCMEIGHFPIVKDGALCGCGRTGCLETVASRLAISAEAAKAAYRGEAPYLFKNAGTDLARMRSGVLAESIAAGDTAVEQIVRKAAHALGRAIGGTINLLAPDVVVLGGGLVEAMPDLYLEETGKGAAETTMPSFADQYTLRAAKLADDATILGAAGWVAASLEEPKEGA